MFEEKMLELYYSMLRIRRFEEQVSELFAKGRMGGFLHLCIGQEASEVGVCAALNKDDWITGTHRGHGQLLAKGADMRRIMAELYGKETGYCGGRGGSMHIAVSELGILGTNGIVGASLPLALGAAFSAKYRKSGQVAVSFFGDGAVSEGVFHESMNLAVVFKLPVVFVCENNQYGVGTKQSSVRGVEQIADKAAGYGMPGYRIDGNNVEEVFETASRAVSQARSGGGPTLIECVTYRWHTHFEGEPDTYRSKEEVAQWKARDPIASYRAKILSSGIPQSRLSDIEARVEQEILDAVNYAESSRDPNPASALEGVYV